MISYIFKLIPFIIMIIITIIIAYREGLAEGIVLDTQIEKGRGIVVDLLIQSGSLAIGDVVVVDTAYGKG